MPTCLVSPWHGRPFGIVGNNALGMERTLDTFPFAGALQKVPCTREAGIGSPDDNRVAVIVHNLKKPVSDALLPKTALNSRLMCNRAIQNLIGRIAHNDATVFPA